MFPLSFSNPWVAGADQARWRAPAWLIAGLGTGLAAGVVVLGGRLGALATEGVRLDARGRVLADALVPELCVFLPLLAVAFAGAALEGRNIVPAGPRFILSFAVNLALGAAAYAAAVGLAGLAGHVTVGHGGLTAAAALGGVALGAGLTLFQSGAEEIYFRGWIQPVLCARWGPWLGLLVTSVVFALLHLIAGPANPIALVNTALAGLVFGLIALRFGGILAPVAAHAAWNWTEGFGLGTDPNPGVGPLGSLVDLDLTGDALWTGGAGGLNASLAVTVVLVTAAAVLVGWRGRSN